MIKNKLKIIFVDSWKDFVTVNLRNGFATFDNYIDG